MKRLASTRATIASALLLAGCTLRLPGVVIAPTPQASATAAALEASATLPPVPSATPTTPQPTPTTTSTPQPVGPSLERLGAGREIVVRSIRMLDSTKGWAIGAPAGATDRILLTTDGGATWRDVSPPEQQQPETRMLAVGAFSSEARAWVAYALENPGQVPQVALVWRTDDGGATWTASAPLDINPLMGIYQPSHLIFIDSEHGWLLVHAGAGMNHDYIAIYRTTDGGASWIKIVDPFLTNNVQSCYKTGIFFTTPLDGWMTGDCGGVAAGVLFFRTTNSGETWDVVRLPPPPDALDLYERSDVACGAHSISFSDAQHGRVAVTCRMYNETPSRDVFYLYRSENGGRLWVPMAFPGEQAVFLTKDLGWAVGPTVRRTTDGGQTWSEMGKVAWQGQFSFVSETLGWAVAHAQEELALVMTRDSGRDWVILNPRTVAP
jgi:photosystem II stability/assembly factor-like uncharacterized protein